MTLSNSQINPEHGITGTLIRSQFAVQQLYANGFVINLSAADLNVVILRDNVANATISMSFTTAKTLVEKLGEAVNRLEKITGNEIMTIDVVQEALKGEFERQGKGTE